MPDANPLVLKLEQSGLLSADDKRILAELTVGPRTVAAETVLVRQGERPCGMHLVLSGFAYRYKILADGRRQIIGLLLPGDFCDLQSAILRKADHYIATLTESSIVVIPQKTVDDLVLAPSSIARALWWSTLVDESILREWLANMGQRPADKWLALFFCELLLRLQIVDCADEDACPMPITQDKLGDILGITSIHVNRILKALRGQDLLHIRERRATFPDVARLRSFCGFDPGYLHLMAQHSSAEAA